MMSKNKKAFMIGTGIGSLAAAASMIRDGGMSGSNITIFEAMPVLGGSLDGGGTPGDGYTMRGGRMLTTDNYECTWDLFKSIPSLEHPGKTVFDETVEFNEVMKSCSKARLIDRNRAIVDVKSMGFSMADRTELLTLAGCNRRSAGSLFFWGGDVVGINEKRPTCRDSGVQLSDSQRQGGRRYEDRRIRSEMQTRTDRQQDEFHRRTAQNHREISRKAWR